MNYMFDSNVAEIVGVDGAVMLQNISFWIEKNKANNKHFYDDSYWTYNTVNAFEKLFPFWSKKQISRILKNLIEGGYLIDGNYNKLNYDRTKWYAITQKGYSILPNGKMEVTKEEIPNDQTGEPIPDINTYINTDIYIPGDEEEIWNMYPNKRGKAQAIKKIPSILKKYGKDQLSRCVERYSNEVKGKESQFILNGSTFFNGRFEDYLDNNYKSDTAIDIKGNIEPKTVEIDKSKLGDL
ncbi:hypothetical protein C1H57_08455 [Clostridium sp. 2-1]|uniref:hypothetical protein n=1 Tax=Clostridium TaxID=1485 RepID=UPI00098CA9CB|nr:MULTISPECIES: hypothetical protein [Clostridium]MBN7575438.1 hypothetical protein [Clostridium beijerinckii]MBN7580749.1 hypothetical protein [Clostridium beijerinckii]MBN7585202.1 hypothetical protein [Clostridium beijerinckii]MBO0521992.1 hypothetical protein [Clostridium beijerinckii]NRT77670.1 hypothetical protein [Clostridium beijerinckii]